MSSIDRGAGGGALRPQRLTGPLGKQTLASITIRVHGLDDVVQLAKSYPFRTTV